MKKILLINRDSSSSGGQEVYTTQLANGLSNNASVSILSLKGDFEFSGLNKEINEIKLRPLQIFDEKVSKELFSPKIKDFFDNYDCIIINNPLTLFAACCLFLIQKEVTVITVFHSKSFSPNIFKNFINTLRRKFFTHIVAAYSSKNIFLTQNDRDFFHNENKKLEAVPSEIIGNGISTKTMNPKDSYSTNDKIKVLFVGKLTPSKGVLDLLSVAKNWDNSNTISFNFVGAGPLAPIIQSYKNCSYLGLKKKDELKDIYHDADIFVLPSYSEGFPLTLLEAMASGLPIVTSNIFGLKEVVGNKNNFFIQPGDQDALKQSITLLATTPQLRKSIGKENYQYAKEKRSIKAMIQKYSEVLL